MTVIIPIISFPTRKYFKAHEFLGERKETSIKCASTVSTHYSVILCVAFTTAKSWSLYPLFMDEET